MYGKIRRFFRLKRFDASAAQDLTQQVYEVLLKKAAQSVRVKNQEAFAMGVARMIAYKSWVKARRRETSAFDSTNVSVSQLTSSPSQRYGRTMAVQAAMESLPIEDQILLEMRFLYRHTIDECAAISNRPKITTRRRLDAAVKKLRAALIELKGPVEAAEMDPETTAVHPTLAAAWDAVWPRSISLEAAALPGRG